MRPRSLFFLSPLLVLFLVVSCSGTFDISLDPTPQAPERVQGLQGAAGKDGLAGAAGAAGAAGSAGASGAAGTDGEDGATGATGSIGADGLGLISYRDVTNQDLKIAHCENAFCAPYFRRR